MLSVIVDSAIYRDGRRTQTSPDLSEALAEARAGSGSFLWVGVREPTPQEFDRISREFALHPLAVENALQARQRPKLEVYQDSLLLVLRPIAHESGARVRSGELMLFVGDSFVLTIRHGGDGLLSRVRRGLESDPLRLRHGPTAVLYAVSDAVVDEYVEAVADLQVDLEELEEEVFAPPGRDAKNVASRIYAFKRQLVEFRRATVPLGEPLSRLAATGMPFVHDHSRPFFRDVADHLSRVDESVEGLDRLLSDILSAHLAQMGVQQNDDMRKISAWAAMAAVPTLLAGIYGMNFRNMPELRWPWGYPGVLGLMLVVILGLYRLFKRRSWL
ncbi:magnesium/cobalt transporter CorA [Streptomyces sp. TP-A0874]|uniref:magnesium/cobalt transporter CorA n=1 Tax=Streptomyces sp. TP-A0874 TaxID=549819 RepID=UPI00147D214B|nr:magnesium/cobalt transporter CorA [Streptomyces sp. TP-A0874]